MKEMFKKKITAQDNVFNAFKSIRNELYDAMTEIIQEQFDVIKFDSGDGYSSVGKLEDNFDVEWSGITGTRGTTTIYLQKDDVRIKDIKSYLAEKGIIDDHSEIRLNNKKI